MHDLGMGTVTELRTRRPIEGRSDLLFRQLADRPERVAELRVEHRGGEVLVSHLANLVDYEIEEVVALTRADALRLALELVPSLAGLIGPDGAPATAS